MITGYHLQLVNPVNPLCSYCKLCAQSLTNCTTCSNSTYCTACDSTFYVNYTSSSVAQCKQCNMSIAGCQLCSLNNSCSQCYPDYLNMGTYCLCLVNSLSYCTACTIPTQCDTCLANYFVNPITKLCDLCTSLFQCLTCDAYNNCTSCNQYYIPVTNITAASQLCQSCSSAIDNCYDCSSTVICIQCNSRFGVNTTNQCQPCNVLFPHCSLCQNSSVCLRCEINNQTFTVNGTTCIACNDFDPQCTQCQLNSISTWLECTFCNTGFILSLVDGLCKSCSTQIDDCQNCYWDSIQARSKCSLCTSQFDVDPNGTCKICKVGNYVTRYCLNSSGCASTHMILGQVVCLSCDSSANFFYNPVTKSCQCQYGFSLITGLNICSQKCGDGIKVNMQCDDGNKVNGDGCSDQCLIESNFDCSENANGLTSCTFLSDISIVYEYTLRTFGQNKASLYFSVTPASTALNKVDWNKATTFNFSQSIKMQVTYSNGILIVTVEYSSDIQDQNIDLLFTFDQTVVRSAPQALSLKLSAINGPLTYDSSHSTFKVFNISGYVLGVFCLLMFLISTYFHKMIGLQTLQFIQLLYFVRVISSDVSHSSFYAFNSLKLANGYNQIIDDVQNQGYQTMAPQFSKLQMGVYFLQNCNLMLIPIILTCIIYIGYSIKKTRLRSQYLESNEKIYKDQFTITKRLLQWIYDNFVFSYTLALLYMTVFSMLSYMFSQLKYDTSSTELFVDVSYGSSIIVVFCLFAIFSSQFVSGIKKFIQLSNKDSTNAQSKQKQLQHGANIQNNGYHHLYVPIYLTYQLLMLSIMSLFIADITFQDEIALVVCLGYFIGILVWSPYNLAVHNFGIIFNQLTVTVFLIVQVLVKYNILTSTSYNIALYIFLSLIFISLGIEIIRLYIHRKMGRHLAFNQSKEKQNASSSSFNKKNIKVDVNNPYIFENQLQSMQNHQQKYFQKDSFGKYVISSVNKYKNTKMIKNTLLTNNFQQQINRPTRKNNDDLEDLEFNDNLAQNNDLQNERQKYRNKFNDIYQ